VEQQVEIGRRIYMEGILPSGESITGVVQGDIPLTAEQVVCAFCHRRSGMGSTEGQEVIPVVTGEILYNPLRLTTSKPPLAPVQREAYTDETLKRAIRDGIDVSGKPFQALMPRYALSDQDLDSLLAYLRTLATGTAPGVDERDIHFATVLADSTDPGARKAMLDLMYAFFEQKNSESRHESSRAENAPWHKERLFGPYRKWVLHVWELTGPRDTWGQQLAAKYEEQPVFAVLNGVVPGDWRPLHGFCEEFQVPCLFPTTDLPVIDEEDFYTVYLSKGMVLEGEGIAFHLAAEGLLAQPVVQVYRVGDERGETAAAGLRDALTSRGGSVADLPLAAEEAPSREFWQALAGQSEGGAAVVWLSRPEMETFWEQFGSGPGAQRLYLSTTLFGTDAKDVPLAAVDDVYFVSPQELPDKIDRLLLRSTGWLRAKRIYAPEHKRVQGNAYFALKMAGGALKGLYGYFSREYLLEQIEHMVDNAIYLSVYPRLSLAPGQRFVAKGCYIAKPSSDGTGRLEAVTRWIAP
jgi:cytochrome c553